MAVKLAKRKGVVAKNETYGGETRGGIGQADAAQKPKVKDPDSLRREASQAATRLLRCATALRVTAPHGCGSRRLVWPKGSLSARPRPEA